MSAGIAARLAHAVERLREGARNRWASSDWPPFTRLLLVDDGAAWVLSWEMQELAALAARLGIHVERRARPHGIRHQSVFFASHFVLLSPRNLRPSSRNAIAYFHGRPGTGSADFDRCYETLRRHHHRIARIQVTNRAFLDVILRSGIDAAKVFLIPIGVNIDTFIPASSERKRRARRSYALPESAVIVGSFQKDGDGWGEGLQPKRVKGPDVFVQVIARLKPHVRDLFVLLSGPARGYVKAELDRIGVPYRHVYLENYPDIVQLYHAIDLYLVTSREEGGPKAVLESMACGVPLVTTRVGQAADLVRHGENGWMADVDDVEALAHWSLHVLEHAPGNEAILTCARATAEENSYAAQLPLWEQFFRGFVEW